MLAFCVKWARRRRQVGPFDFISGRVKRHLIFFILSFYVSYVHRLKHNFNPFIIETKLKGTASLSRTIILHPPRVVPHRVRLDPPSDLESRNF